MVFASFAFNLFQLTTLKNVYFGIILALVFAGIYVLVIGANALEAYVILSKYFEGWRTPLDDMKPGIYMVILPHIAHFS